MKSMFIVSTGRCGTTRLAELISKYGPNDLKVVHQVATSRLSNVLGNIMLLLDNSQWLKKILIEKILAKNKNNFLTTDPLVSLIIPEEMILSKDVAIIHLVRDKASFGRSFYQFTRKKRNSFIAHNFIPFWQPKVKLFENMILGNKMIEKYMKVADYKTEIFEKLYSQNPNYVKINMEEAFMEEGVFRLVGDFFKCSFDIPKSEFSKKTNQSK